MAKRSRACTDPEQEDVKRKKVEASSVIKVTGLSSTISQSWIKSTFRRFGEVTNIEHSEEEGTVYIHFDTKEAADTACKNMNGEMVADKTLAVEIHQVSSRSMSTRVATTGEVPSTQFSFNLDKTPATASVPSLVIDFENLPSLPKSGTQSLFSRPVRCGLDLSTAHSAMLPTLTQQPVDPVKPQSTVAVTQAEVFTLSSSRYKEMAASKASSPHQAIQKCQQSSKDPQSQPSRVVQRGKAMEGKGASKSTTISTVECNTGYVSKPMKTSSPPSLKHAITYPAAMPTLNSSKSSDNQRAHVSRSIPPLMRRTQTEPIPSLSTTKDAKTEHETVPIVKKKDTTSEGDLEGNPFKQALSNRPSLALQAGVSSSIKPKKQVMATLSEVIEFSHPMYKRIITSKYKSDLEALQNRYKVLVGGKEVEGVALTLTGSSVGNVMQAKRELRTLERNIQGKISDSTFTLSCGFLPCLADIETVTRLQEIEKQNVVEFAVVTNTCETQLTQVRKMVKDKLADAKGPLCLSQVHSFTEMRLGYFWKVRNATSGEVVGFDSHTNDLINAAYIGRQSTCSFFYNGHSYTIDFSQMTVSDDAAQGPTHTLVKEPVWCRYTSDEFGYAPLRESISSILECTFQQGASGYITIEGRECVVDFNSRPMQAHSVGAEEESCCIQRQPIVSSECVAPVITVKVKGIMDTLSSAETKFRTILQSQVTSKTLTIPSRLSARVIQLFILGMARQYCIQCSLTDGLHLMGTKQMVADVSRVIQEEIIRLLSECNEPIHPTTPPRWAPQTKDIQLCPVSEGGSEWVHIEKLMKESLKSVKIQAIDRIQNRHLWQKYVFFKDLLKKRMNGKCINEKELFHGTRLNSPDKIYESDKGFDFRFASEDSLWGQGIYFAVNASYSDRGYAYHLSGGKKQLILAKVVTGESGYMSKQQKMSTPPLKPGETVERYDTVRATTGGTEIYVVYDHEKAYPAYLISYLT